MLPTSRNRTRGPLARTLRNEHVVRTVTVEHSVDHLLALQQQMIDDRTALQSPDAPLV